MSSAQPRTAKSPFARCIVQIEASALFVETCSSKTWYGTSDYIAYAADARKAPATERAFAADWRDFRAFAGSIGEYALPAEPETVALDVVDLAARGRRRATIARKLATIGIYHEASEFDPPTAHGVVRDVERGCHRKLSVAQQ